MLRLDDIPELAKLDFCLATARGLPAPGTLKFELTSNRFHVHQAKARSKRGRRGVKRLIKPDNAHEMVEHMSLAADDRLHCVVRGDFVLCDIIPLVIKARGSCPHLRIATLGLSASNAATLVGHQERGLIGDITLIVSHYFRGVDRTTTYREVRAILDGRARVAVTRSHAKVILLPTSGGDFFSLEGSANLRSSDNLEQMVVVNDRDTHDFHAGWIDELAAKPPDDH